MPLEGGRLWVWKAVLDHSKGQKETDFQPIRRKSVGAKG